jgi:hypothetical protein
VVTLTDEMLFHLCGRAMPESSEPAAILLAALHAYDLRSGGIETQNRGEKQGFGLSHRNKHLFEAQETLILLAQIAHNIVTWTCNESAEPGFRLSFMWTSASAATSAASPENTSGPTAACVPSRGSACASGCWGTLVESGPAPRQ